MNFVWSLAHSTSNVPQNIDDPEVLERFQEHIQNHHFKSEGESIDHNSGLNTKQCTDEINSVINEIQEWDLVDRESLTTSSQNDIDLIPSPKKGDGNCSQPSKKRVYVSNYLQYESGLGFELNTGILGVYFNDSTSIILSPEGTFFKYIECRHKDAASTNDFVIQTHMVCSYPMELQKKVELLMLFKSKSNGTTDKENRPSANNMYMIVEGNTLLLFLREWTKTKTANVFHLSCNTFQVIFHDKSEILLTPKHAIIYGRNRQRLKKLRLSQLVLLLQLFSTVSFYCPIKDVVRYTLQSLSGNFVSASHGRLQEPVVRNKIEFLVNRLLLYNNQKLTLGEVDPQLLEDYSLYLTKEGIFESVMQRRLKDASNANDVAKLHNLRDILGDYVSTERRKRARAKLSYLVESVLTGQFEESMQKMIDSDEIDEELMLCVSGSIEKLLQQKLGGHGVLHDDPTQVESDSTAVQALQMIEKRLKAETVTQYRNEVRLLSKLLHETNLEARFEHLSTNLNNIEALVAFNEFLADGIKFLREREQEDFRSEHKIQRKAELPVGTVERMRDIQLDVHKLMQNLKSTSVYQSTDKPIAAYH